MDRREFAIYAITKHGIELGERLAAALPGSDLFVPAKHAHRTNRTTEELSLPMGPTLQATWKTYSCHIHIISVGAVVRMISPLLESKKVDPAVVCIDDAAQFAICVLSGHVGRGNAYTNRIADVLEAQAVVTTASDVGKTLTVDILGRDLGWTLADPDRNVTSSCAAVVNEERVLFVQETGEPDWWPLESALPSGVEYARSLDDVNPRDYSALLIASDRELEALYPTHVESAVIYRPKSLVVGIGCDRGIASEVLERGLTSVFNQFGLAESCIRSVATVDVKGDEEGLIDLCRRRGWELELRPAEYLDSVEGVENPSELVRKYVGTGSVGEAACLAVSGATKLLVAKQKYTETSEGLNMTIAIARIPFSRREVLPRVESEIEV